jgi:CubicO group peptidase (beta-lactamase class C family)
MNWAQAAATIADIAESWTVEDGPGGALAIFDGHRNRGEAAGGLMDLSHELAFTTETPIRIASVSKQFLAAVLLSDMPVKLTDTLGQHLMLPKAVAAITVGQALDMTSGLPDLVETLWMLGVSPSASVNRHRLMDAASQLTQLNFEPGTQISYSNTGYRLVQAALQAQGVTYAHALNERLFRPLGLACTLPEDAAVPVRGLATGYGRAPMGNWRIGRYGMHFSASGGMTASAADLARWGRTLLADRTPIPGLLAKLSAERHLADGRPTGYGLGLQRSQLGERTLIGHGGSLPGYRSHILLDPQAEAGVVVLCNRDDLDPGQLALRVMADLHGIQAPKPATRLLPEGLFVTDEGPFWLHHHAGVVSFMGASEAVYDAGDGTAASRSAALPMRLSASNYGIAGEIGHVARSFKPVPPRAPANPAWAGHYSTEIAGVRLGLEVKVERGHARLVTPPLGTGFDLRPLDSTRAVAQHSEGGWVQSFCASFAGGTLSLASQRARTLVFNAR